MGPLCEVEASPDWTVEDAKAAIQARSGIARGEQRLIVGSTVLSRNAEPLIAAVNKNSVELLVTLIQRDPEQTAWIDHISNDSGRLGSAPDHIKKNCDVVLEAVKSSTKRENGAAILRYAAEELR